MADLFAFGVGLLAVWMTAVLVQLREAWCPKCCCCCCPNIDDDSQVPVNKNEWELSTVSEYSEPPSERERY